MTLPVMATVGEAVDCAAWIEQTASTMAKSSEAGKRLRAGSGAKEGRLFIGHAKIRMAQASKVNA